MNRLLTGLLDLVFPPSPEAVLLRPVLETQFLSHYHPHPANPNTTALLHYHDPLVEAAIIANKFQYNQKAAILLSSILKHWCQSEIDSIVFVPIPLGHKRERERGHNQVETILQSIQPNPSIAHWLRRRRETKPQTSLDRAERQINMQNAFICDQTIVIPPGCRRVILIDDVATTGATLQAARAELAPHLPSSLPLHCLALAH